MARNDQALTPYFPLGGGLDLVTPAVAMKPGSVIAALNYEPLASGYRRLRGYERFDGRAGPRTNPGYSVLHFTAGDLDTDSIVEGSTITSSGGVWRGYALGPAVITAGTTAAGTAVGYVGVVEIVAGFGPATFARVGGTTFGTVDSYVPSEAVPEAGNGTWNAAETLRGQIAAVPGSGPVRGVWRFKDEIVAVRDSADGTKGVMYRATVNGWIAVSLAKTYTFDTGGTYEPVVGNLAQGDTSFAAGTITAITLTSGTWAGGDAAGTITILPLNLGGGAFVNGETITVTEVYVAPPVAHAANLTLTDAGADNTLPPGGAYKFLNHNFYGASNLTRTYGANGVGPAIVYDPVAQTLTPISSGMVVDTPTGIAVHRQSLFLGFPGGSVQFSEVGEPLSFDPILGAGEIGIGDDMVDFANPPNSLAIFGANSIHLLYGSDASDYQLETLTREAGALPHTARAIGQVIYADNRGLRSLSTTQAFGNFTMGTLSRLIAPLLEDKRRDGIQPSSSLVFRTRDQYWLFFDDGTGIIVFMGGKQPSILPFNLDKTVTTSCSVEDEGVERVFIGCDDGFVYELNAGTSFDGEPVEHYLRLAFNHFGAPQQNKRIDKASVDVEVTGPTTLTASFDFDYGAVAGSDPDVLTVTTGGSAIDSLGTNELYYASQIETIAQTYIGQVAKNVSMKIGGATTDEEPHTLTGVTYYIHGRGLQR